MDDLTPPVRLQRLAGNICLKDSDCVNSCSRQETEPKPKLFGPDIFGWGGVLPPGGGGGAEKFDMSLETRETKLSWRDIPGFCRDIRSGPISHDTAILSLRYPISRDTF